MNYNCSMQSLKKCQITTTFLLWYRPINFSHVAKSCLKIKKQLQTSNVDHSRSPQQKRSDSSDFLESVQ